jgi:hypothetical protein
MITDADIQAIHEKVQPIIGMPSWRVWRGIGSFITFEFGEPVTKRGYTHGEWSLWVQHAAWRIESPDEFIAGCEDRNEFIDAGLKRLENVPIQSIVVSRPALDTVITFENGLKFLTFTRYTQHNRRLHWELFTPDHYVLIIGPSISWSFRRSDSVDD